MPEKQSSSPVFYDPRGRRWKRVRRTWLALAIFVTIIVAIFIASVLANPSLAPPTLRPLKNLGEIKPKPVATPITNARELKAKKHRLNCKRPWPRRG